MSLLVFAIIVLIFVGIVCAIVYQIPFPAGMAWARWAIPAVVLLIALVVIAQRAGLA